MKLKFELITGKVVSRDSDKVLSGLTFEPDNIKNELDKNLVASQYKVDDYLYFPYPDKLPEPSCKYLELEPYGLFKDKDKIYYLTDYLIDSYDKSLNVLLKYLKREHLGDEEKNILLSKFKDLECPTTDLIEAYPFILNIVLTRYSETISSKIAYDDLFIKFLVITMLKVKIDSNLVTKNNFKDINHKAHYKFNTTKKNHLDMLEDLEKFFNRYNIKYDKVDYDTFSFINVNCSPLFKYYLEFEQNMFKYLSRFSKVLQVEFIHLLFNHCNNNFNCNNNVATNIKNILLQQNKTMIKYPSRSEKGFTVSVVRHEEEMKKLTEDVIYLDKGYLVRIIGIEPM